MEIKAKLNYLRISPRKVRLVADLVRQKPVEEAEKVLSFVSKRGAEPLLKLLKSAKTDAKNNFHLDEKKLYIKKIEVTPGPIYKRSMPRARGHADPIKKRTSHIIIILDEKKDEKKSNKKDEKKVKKELIKNKKEISN